MYKEFKKYSKKEWLNTFRFEENALKYLGTSTLPHIDDQQCIQTKTGSKKILLSEKINLTNSTNAQILNALNGGANALTISIQKQLIQTDFTAIFENVVIEIIRIDFDLNDTIIITDFLNEFKKYLKENNYSSSKINISINLKNPTYLLQYLGILPNLKFRISQPLIEEENDSQVIDLLVFAENILNENHQNLNLKKIAKSILFELHLSSQIYWNIAKINTLKILWQNILKAYSIDADFFLKINIGNSPKADPYQSIIDYTAQAITALNCGVNQIEIAPILLNENLEISNRITRNIQNILIYESQISPKNPATEGSYFMDNLTKKYAEKVWKTFKNLKEK